MKTIPRDRLLEAEELMDLLEGRIELERLVRDFGLRGLTKGHWSNAVMSALDRACCILPVERGQGASEKQEVSHGKIFDKKGRNQNRRVWGPTKAAQLRVQGMTPETVGRKFSLWEMEPGRWKANLNNSTGRLRKKFKAVSLEEAVEKAAHHLFGNEEINPASPIMISDCFFERRKRLSCSEATIKTDYWPRVRQFVRWADSHGLAFWSELRLQHLQQYANEATESGNLRSTINLKVRVVSMAARWAALNWPEQCHDFTQGFRLPKGREGNRRLRRDSLSLEEVVEFLLFLRGPEKAPLGSSGHFTSEEVRS